MNGNRAGWDGRACSRGDLLRRELARGGEVGSYLLQECTTRVFSESSPAYIVSNVSSSFLSIQEINKKA